MTIFTTTSYPVGALIADIDLGKVGLPDLQRPFVWANVKVRSLFDSLYKGYPAGFLLFWDTGAEGGLKGIGAKNSKAVPKLAIVDGQSLMRHSGAGASICSTSLMLLVATGLQPTMWPRCVAY